MKRLGATGLLIEYEDMFPYGPPIEHLSAGYAYTVVEVREMLTAAAGRFICTKSNCISDPIRREREFKEAKTFLFPLKQRPV